MVDNNITMFGYPTSYHQDVFNASEDQALKKLAETYHVAETWDEWKSEFVYHIHEKGTHADVFHYLEPWQLESGKWWRSTEHIPGLYPYFGWMTRINWYLNEVIFTIYSFRYYEYNIETNFYLNFLLLGIYNASDAISRGKMSFKLVPVLD